MLRLSSNDGESFAAVFTLFPVKYRAVFYVCCLAGAALWIAWCLYWPFYARRQDMREALVEIDQAYRFCLQQEEMTAANCSADRAARLSSERRLIAPPGENAYQSFAGKSMGDAIVFMSTLCLLPLLLAYAVLRVLLAGHSKLLYPLVRRALNRFGCEHDEAKSVY